MPVLTASVMQILILEGSLDLRWSDIGPPIRAADVAEFKCSAKMQTRVRTELNITEVMDKPDQRTTKLHGWSVVDFDVRLRDCA